MRSPTVAVLQHVRGFKFRQNRGAMRLHFLPGTPDIGESREHVRGPQAARGPLPRALLRGAAERVRAERRGFDGCGAAREKRADESGEHVAAAARREPRIAACDDMLGTAEIGDDGRNTFE